jgi:peptide/nickel transport system substrate-binding protein
MLPSYSPTETLNYPMNKNVTGSIITPTLSLYMENFCFTETSRS